MTNLDSTQYPDLFDIKVLPLADPSNADSELVVDSILSDKDVFIDQVTFTTTTDPGAELLVALAYVEFEDTLTDDNTLLQHYNRCTEFSADLNPLGDNSKVTVTGRKSDTGVAAIGKVDIGTGDGASAGNINGDTIVLTDADGVTKTYEFDSDASIADGDLLANGNVGVDADASNADNAAGLKAAIESANGHNGSITASVATGVVTLTQAKVGRGGNTQITATATANRTSVVEHFGGGVSPGEANFVPAFSRLRLINSGTNFPAAYVPGHAIIRYRERRG